MKRKLSSREEAILIYCAIYGPIGYTDIECREFTNLDQKGYLETSNWQIFYPTNKAAKYYEKFLIVRPKNS